MRIQEHPCTSCQAPTPLQVAYCPACGHEAHARPGRCHCPACLTSGKKGGWKALESEEAAARWAFFETLLPDKENR